MTTPYPNVISNIHLSAVTNCKFKFRQLLTLVWLFSLLTISDFGLILIYAKKKQLKKKISDSNTGTGSAQDTFIQSSNEDIDTSSSKKSKPESTNSHKSKSQPSKKEKKAKSDPESSNTLDEDDYTNSEVSNDKVKKQTTKQYIETADEDIKKITKINVKRSEWKEHNHNSPTAHARENSLPKKEGIVLRDDVFYGRAIIQLPRSRGLLSHATLETPRYDALKRELEEFPEIALNKFNMTSENSQHLVQICTALIVENREYLASIKLDSTASLDTNTNSTSSKVSGNTNLAKSRFAPWLELVQNETLLMLELTERQRNFLNGTTVEKAASEMEDLINIVVESSGNFTLTPKILDQSLGETHLNDCASKSNEGSSKCPVLPSDSDAEGALSATLASSLGLGANITFYEARWAVSVVMRHARTVWPSEEDRHEKPNIPMQIVPLPELLLANFHPDASIAITFQEERIAVNYREHDVILQIARRDMAQGEENFIYPGRFSNSDLYLRYNMTFKKNHVGIGDNVTHIPNGPPTGGFDNSQRTKAARELARFNCTSSEDFELRFSTRGRPSTKLVRCWRVNWFMQNGWYNPGLAKKNRISEMFDRWPPPKAYKDEELWLPMTQADNDLTELILRHCTWQRDRLRNGINRKELDYFKNSKNTVDRKLWELRVEESQTWKKCEQHMTTVKKGGR